MHVYKLAKILVLQGIVYLGKWQEMSLQKQSGAIYAKPKSLDYKVYEAESH